MKTWVIALITVSDLSWTVCAKQKIFSLVIHFRKKNNQQTHDRESLGLNGGTLGNLITYRIFYSYSSSSALTVTINKQLSGLHGTNKLF